MSLPRSRSEAARVTMMPAATEINSAGICAASPSPTVSSEYFWVASAKPRSICSMPDDDPADEVDRGDDQRRHRVAFDELRGAVHRAVEVGLAPDLRASLARLVV